MCSRYSVAAAPKTIAARFGVPPAPGLKPRDVLVAGDDAPVIIAAPGRRMSMMHWGLLPGWAKGPQAKPQINARAESLADKPFFRDAFRWRRALIPADRWSETPRRGDKSPVDFRLKDGEAFAFAGIWDTGSFAIVTVEPNPLVARIHDRMPAVLSRDDEDAWLDPKTPPERLGELLRPYPSDLLNLRRALDASQGDLFGTV